MSNKRLRVFDLQTPWFWVTCFYRPGIYGDSWLCIDVHEPNHWRNWWFYFWKWEETPDNRGVDFEPLSERDQKL